MPVEDRIPAHPAKALALAILAGCLGAVVGFGVGAAVASLLGFAAGVPTFEGALGYLAVFIGGPIGAVVGLTAAAVLALRWAGYRGFSAIASRLLVVTAGVIGLGGAALAVLWVARPLVNANGPAPQLVFQIRLPPGVPPPPLNAISAELQTSRNRMPATLRSSRQDDARSVVSGSVELYYRTWQRTLVLTLPDKTDVLFELALGLSPSHDKAFGPWRGADYVAQPGAGEARRATAGDRYEMRNRVVWAEED